jgi:hypothetical protein
VTGLSAFRNLIPDNLRVASDRRRPAKESLRHRDSLPSAPNDKANENIYKTHAMACIGAPGQQGLLSGKMLCAEYRKREPLMGQGYDLVDAAHLGNILPHSQRPNREQRPAADVDTAAPEKAGNRARIPGSTDLAKPLHALGIL